MTPALNSYINNWLKKADNDLISAQRLLEIEPRILDTACFHCQQAVEKYLKAFLTFKGVSIERTHNIVFLLSKCADFNNVFINIDPRNIDVYAVQSRYPDYAELPELNEAKALYNFALEIKYIVLPLIDLTIETKN
jgi:HEPN domain-containing protein